jgi:hypothetical protein
MKYEINKRSNERRTGKDARRLYNLLLAPSEKKPISDLIKRGRALRPKVNYGTMSYIFREGARLFVQQQNRLLDKAEAGMLHAKKRNTKTNKAA